MIARYSIQEIEQIWSDTNKFSIWLEIEKLNCEALANISKLISHDDLTILIKDLKYDLDDIYQIEQETKHDVIAFTRAISKNFNGEQKKWIHYGLTSTDIVDTANAVAIKQTNAIILKALNELKTTITTLAIEHKYTYCIGRTHGMHAEIVTFGFKLIGWVDELNRQLERFNLASEHITVCKISGAVGTYANTSPAIQAYIAKKLGLEPAKFSTQIIQRDNHSFYFDVLKSIGLSINKFATELRHLHRTEVNEVSEYFESHQKGSSAMPHKKNPIGLENVCGLSRLLMGYAIVANENVNLWHERDISHSSNERIIFVDAASTLVYIIRRFNKIIKTLIVNHDQMLNNINLSGTKIYSGRVLNYLIANTNLSRETIYDEIQALILKCDLKQLDFIDELKHHHLHQYIENYAEIVDFTHQSKYIECIFDTVLNTNPNKK